MIQEAAWERGLDGAAIPDMTPSEARGLFAGLEARRRQADELAWQAGAYTAIGVNAPKKYPRQPRSRERDMLTDNRDMTDAQMQTWAKAFAERWNRDADQCGDAGNTDQGDQ